MIGFWLFKFLGSPFLWSRMRMALFYSSGVLPFFKHSLNSWASLMWMGSSASLIRSTVMFSDPGALSFFICATEVSPHLLWSPESHEAGIDFLPSEYGCKIFLRSRALVVFSCSLYYPITVGCKGSVFSSTLVNCSFPWQRKEKKDVEDFDPTQSPPIAEWPMLRWQREKRKLLKTSAALHKWTI